MTGIYCFLLCGSGVAGFGSAGLGSAGLDSAGLGAGCVSPGALWLLSDGVVVAGFFGRGVDCPVPAAPPGVTALPGVNRSAWAGGMIFGTTAAAGGAGSPSAPSAGF